MATRDVSRTLFSRAKRYSGSFMQQGRVLTDDDFNSDVELDHNDDRLSRLGVIGPYGSADQGFAVSNPAVIDGRIDFDIGPGTLWLGGLRLENPGGQSFLRQLDWLTNPGVPAPGAGERFDLVYVTAWRQHVSAVEDGELMEPALGGPDTTTRVRPMARLAIAEDVGVDTCHEAWSVLRQRLAADGLGQVGEDMALVADTNATVSFVGNGGDDLCAPEVIGGYLGAENQAIQAMLLGGDQFIWGFDNAAPLYRVAVEDAGQTIRFLTEPKDVAHWPAQGQTVEVLPWGAMLSNGEKLAEEFGPGHFATVDGPYNPDSATLTLTAGTAVPAGLGDEWGAHFAAAEILQTRYGTIAPQTPYLFLRVWDRGADATPGPTLTLAGGPTPLGNTGLRLEVNGADRRPGDHWVIAARPQTPDHVLPWELLAGRAPHGIERFVGPVALIRWQGGVGEVINDCRPRFRPLTRIRNCCTYTVGDGEVSHGDFKSIQAAVDALPPEGGEVCVLPGLYEERVALANLRDIRISGCGPRSRVVAPDAGPDPVIDIQCGRNIRIASLGIDSVTGIGLRARGLAIDGKADPIRGLKLERLEVTARDASAIDVRVTHRLELTHSHVLCAELAQDLGDAPFLGGAPAVFVEGEDIIVAENRIEARGGRAIRRPAGGLVIGGGTNGALVRDNIIQGGNGDGITLGHIYMAKPEVAKIFVTDYAVAVANSETYFVGYTVIINDKGCIEVIPPGIGDDPDGEPDLVPVPGGDLRNIEIRDNMILSMELNGIATPIAFRRARAIITSIAGLRIDGNVIKGCATLEAPVLPMAFRIFVAFGGISLSAAEMATITGNRIEANGRSHLEPIVGIHILMAETVVISDNQIVDNGPRLDTDAPPKPGQRGGVVILAAGPHPTAQETAPEIAAIREIGAGMAAARAVGLPAVMVHDNLVQQPLGKALVVLGHGHMSISANHLTSQGTTTRDFFSALRELVADGAALPKAQILHILIDRFLGSSVTVVNTGFSSELGDALLLAAVVSVARRPIRDKAQRSLKVKEVRAEKKGASVASRGWAGAARLLRNGEVLFNGNAVTQSFFDNERSFTLSAGLIVSFDDVSIDANSFSSQVDFIGDFSITNLLSFGWSLRCNGNRFEETLLHTLFSAMTLGFYNNTAHNQATHCLEVSGMPALTVDGPNRILAQALNPLACGGCLAPPFDGLERRVTDQQGNLAPPRIDVINGYHGLWLGVQTQIAFGVGVEWIRMSFVGNDVGALVVQSIGEGGATQTISLNSGQPVPVTMTGSRLTSVMVSQTLGRTIMTELCASRPSASQGPDVKGGQVLDFGGT